MDISNGMYARMVEALTSEKFKLINTVMRLESEVVTQQVVIQKLEEEKGKMHVEAEQLERVIGRLEESIRVQGMVIEKLNEKIEQLEDDDLEDTEPNDLKGMVRRLLKDNSRQAKAMGNYEKEIRKLREENDLLREEIAGYKEALEAAEETLENEGYRIYR